MSVQRQIDRLIAYQAAEWFEAIRGGADEDNAAFVHWICESPRHMEAFLAIAGESGAVRAVLDSGRFDLGATLRATSPEVTPLPTVRVAQPDAAMPRRRTRRRWPLAAVMATATITVFVATAVVLRFGQTTGQQFETPIGEQRTLQLSEGSIVNLNAQSRLQVRFTNTQRDIYLPRGEALFKVTPDPARPFRVHVGDTVVQVLGTQFNVYARQDGSVKVSVLEGKVKVSTGAGPSTEPLLEAGDEAEIGAGGGIRQDEHTDVADAVAWRERKLIFRRTSLEDIAVEFNRYNKHLQIRLEDIEPGAFRFTGAFDADDPQSLAALLARESDLAVERREGEIVVRRR